MSSESPEALWRIWRGGNSKVFETLYDKVAPALYSLCRALTVRSAIAADDLFQETFRKAIGGRFDGGNLEAWLATIARNAFVDLQRAAKRTPTLEADPVDPTSGSVRVEALDLLASLPVELREVVALRHLQGLSIEEVAEKLDLSPATVYRRLAEAFRLLDRNS